MKVLTLTVPAGGGHYHTAKAIEEYLSHIENTECRIDCISQAWAGISNAANNVRVRTALESAMKMLFNREDDLLMLLTPPFEGKEFEPGYIANYLPGVRENGGQYTHGAIWAIIAKFLIKSIL